MLVIRSTLGLALVVALGVGCGADDLPTDQGSSPIHGDGDGDGDEGNGDGEEEEADDEGGDGDKPRDTGDGDGDGDGDDDGGDDAGTKPPMGSGECCDDGNCLCHGDAPKELTSATGPFKTAELKLPLGTVTYPTDAEPPFASVALCGGFTNTGPEMKAWAPFYASYGIVTIIVTTDGIDDPGTRSTKLLAALDQLLAENGKSGSPLFDKLDEERVGTSGYSMGGGGTTIASTKRPTLKTSVGLAAWNPAASGITVPTLLLCGNSDTTAGCSMSQGSYQNIKDPTPKMMVKIDGTTHFNWFGPTDAGGGVSGKYALAFQKVYLEGDTRWKSLLTTALPKSQMSTNIK